MFVLAGSLSLDTFDRDPEYVEADVDFENRLTPSPFSSGTAAPHTNNINTG